MAIPILRQRIPAAITQYFEVLLSRRCIVNKSFFLSIFILGMLLSVSYNRSQRFSENFGLSGIVNSFSEHSEVFPTLKNSILELESVSIIMVRILDRFEYGIVDRRF